jgi:hypothetical protein
MSMSKQVTLTLAGAISLSAVIPGLAGYATAQSDSLERTRAELERLQARIHRAELQIKPVSAVPCIVVPLPLPEDAARERARERLIRDLSARRSRDDAGGRRRLDRDLGVS